jgi:hypothetical protein
MADSPDKPAAPAPTPPKKKRHWLRRFGYALLLLAVVLVGVRLYLPTTITWYVNRTIDRDPIYDGTIGDVELHLWRGAYSIHDIRLNKSIGNVPKPLFHAKSIDLAIEWSSLLKGSVVGTIEIDQPELNFVDGGTEASDQVGSGGPWLAILRDLFPFKINSCEIKNGTVSFTAPTRNPPVEAQITALNAHIDNLGNIENDTKPLVSTVTATGMVYNQAPLEIKMSVDPFSYRPTFQMGLRLIGLDVKKTNDLTRAYGNFDFEHGFFDLVIELDAKEGGLNGYVKPLFRNLRIINLQKDLAENNLLQVFWEALVGGTVKVLSNQPRDQFGTIIPFTGRVDVPQTDILATIGNVLHNAFIRAYLPQLNSNVTRFDGLDFAPGSIVGTGPVVPEDSVTEPGAGGNTN